MLKMAVRRGRSEQRGESYSVPYVEPLSDARTKLADFFSILLGRNRSSGRSPGQKGSSLIPQSAAGSAQRTHRHPVERIEEVLSAAFHRNIPTATLPSYP